MATRRRGWKSSRDAPGARARARSTTRALWSGPMNASSPAIAAARQFTAAPARAAAAASTRRSKLAPERVRIGGMDWGATP